MGLVSLGACVAGFVLDFIFGDPVWLYHPVRLIGKWISFLEKLLRRKTGEKGQIAAGGILVSENDKYSSDIFAMDTYMSLTAYGAKAQDAVTAAIHEIQRLDAMFSVGNTDSDVTTANMQGSATVSDETAYLVEQSLEISRKTDGAFDITIYPVMELWGFTTKNYKVPQADELQETLKRVSYENVSLKDHELVLKK